MNMNEQQIDILIAEAAKRKKSDLKPFIPILKKIQEQCREEGRKQAEDELNARLEGISQKPKILAEIEALKAKLKIAED